MLYGLRYRHTNPPHAPNVMSGCDTIRAFIARICSQPLQIVVEEELVTADRAAAAAAKLSLYATGGRTIFMCWSMATKAASRSR